MFLDALIILTKISLVLGVVMSLAAVLTWAERKQSALIQDRIGPNRANVFGFTLYGLLHPVADGIKLITKEDFIPAQANKAIHSLAPAIAMFPALVTYAVIPFGDTLRLGGREINLQVADLSVGIIFIFSIASLAIYGVMLGGWSSNNNYSLLGGLRAAAQMISYEIALGLSIVGLLMIFETVELDELVRKQGHLIGGWLPQWGIVVQPAAFFFFLCAAIAENKRAPFDLPEGESEIIGYFLEYSGMRFGMFFLAEFADIVIASALLTTLFFGGWQIPFLMADGFHFPGGLSLALPHLLVVLMQVGAFAIKVVFFCWLLLLIRWTLPRFRYDQLMRLGWKYLFPLTLANIFITGVIILALM
jgi:NADH-quinone oxidoreductase subunit H